MKISDLSPVLPVSPLETTSPNGAVAGEFDSILRSAIHKVESAGAAASDSMEKFISGESVDLHSVALAGQKAALNFEMFLQVRNKVVQAYQEVMRMQL